MGVELKRTVKVRFLVISDSIWGITESRGTEEEDPEGEECGVESEAERKGKCRRAFQAKK